MCASTAIPAVSWDDSPRSDRPDGLSRRLEGVSANAERRLAHPELADFPATSTGRRKIANKTHPGNILTRRAVATARRIPYPSVTCGRLGAPRGAQSVFTLFSGVVRDWSSYVWICSLTVASPDPRPGRVLTRWRHPRQLGWSAPPTACSVRRPRQLRNGKPYERQMTTRAQSSELPMARCMVVTSSGAPLWKPVTTRRSASPSSRSMPSSMSWRGASTSPSV